MSTDLSHANSPGLRSLVPLTLLPLALVGSGLASSPWLRAFPASVIAVPLFGAVLLSVLLPMVLNGIGLRRLPVTASIEVALLAFYELLVVLRDPTAFSGLWDGLVHGPSQVLSFALPLVDPRSLLVAPVALCWLASTIVGECIARGWQTVLPYVALLVTFGLTYAATARGIADADDGHHYDTLLAAALLLTLLVLRTAQSWIAQNDAAATTQADGVLPLRGLATGTALAVLLAVAVAATAQTHAFSGPPVAPHVVPPLDQTQPVTPISFVTGLRPADPRNATSLFTVTVDHTASNYISLADLDTYDGDSWTFDRTFPPSGGVVPADPVPALRPTAPLVNQQYMIARGGLAGAPWMPYLQRPQKVSGLSIDVDAASGMITPAADLRAGETYSVRSASSHTGLLSMRDSASVDGYGGSNVPVDVADSVRQLVATLAAETGVASNSGVAFLKAVATDFRSTSRLAGGPATRSTTPSTTRSTTPSTTPAPHASSTASDANQTVSSGTSFADVLTSIRVNHSATPEQFATLMCLVARSVGVAARLATGFRVGSGALAAGSTTPVTTADAWTWVEIPIAGAGWVVLDPSPARSGGPDQRQTQSEQAQTSSASAPPTNELGTAPGAASAPVAPHSAVPGHRDVGVTALVVVLVGLAVLFLVLVLVLVLRKRVRARRRRRSGDPRRRLLGAWQESLDVLQEAGLPDLSNLTSREVSAATDERFGDEPAAQARYLGEAANAAIFSPTSWVEPAAAEAAWRAHVVLRTSVRRRLTLSGRVEAAVRYHRVARTATPAAPASWTQAMRERAQSGRSQGRHSSSARGRRGRRE